MSLTKGEILADLRSVAADLGDSPSVTQYREHGSYSVSVVYDRFGSWNDAIAAAGFEPREPTTAVSRETLLEELRRLADELGHPPSINEMIEHGAHSDRTYKNKFGSWNAAVEAAGLEPNDPPHDGTGATREELLAELRRIGEEHGQPPTHTLVNEHGRYSPRPYYRRFDSWADALAAAGFDVERQVGPISDAELIDELHRLAYELGRPPNSTEVREHSQYALSTYIRRFGSWSDAYAAAEFEAEEAESADAT